MWFMHQNKFQYKWNISLPATYMLANIPGKLKSLPVTLPAIALDSLAITFLQDCVPEYDYAGSQSGVTDHC